MPLLAEGEEDIAIVLLTDDKDDVAIRLLEEIAKLAVAIYIVSTY